MDLQHGELHGSFGVANAHTAASSESISNWQAVQNFMQVALTDLAEDCIVLSFFPIAVDLATEFPKRTLAPRPGATSLDLERAKRLTKRARLILGACVFGDEEMLEAAKRILLQLGPLRSSKVFVALLVRDIDCAMQNTDQIMSQHEKLLDMGIADVIMNPECERGALRRALHASYNAQRERDRRMEYVIESETQEVKGNLEEVEELEAYASYLLWEFIPKSLMTKFPSVDDTIREDEDSMSVGGYRFWEQIPRTAGRVMRAVDKDRAGVAVRCVSKSQVQSPSEVERVYREYRFLSADMIHPNIARCIDFLHTDRRVYVVFEDAGQRNLAQLCGDQRHQRLDEHKAYDCFKQVIRGLASIHQREVVHRDVSLEHVVVRQRGDSHFHYTLVDFRSALKVQSGMVAQTKAGDLPCIAPEIALQASYDPLFVDRWSVGVLLLEIAGGLTSLQTAVDFSSEADLVDALEAITEFFKTPGCHEKALAALGGTSSSTILYYLQNLVLLRPASRMSLVDLSMSFNDPLEHSDPDCAAQTE